MRIMWLGMIIAIPLYIWIGENGPAISWLKFPKAGRTFAILAVLNLVSFSWALCTRYSPALRVFKAQPEDIRGLRRWMNMWIILLCNANSVTLLGLAFRMGGKTVQQTLPFYVVGSLLTLSLWPRQVWSKV
jgi:hypothetical protein